MNDIAVPSYTRGQKIFHWVLALLILFWLFVSGELVEEAEGAQKGLILGFHSGGAILILILTIFRYRLRRQHPVQPVAELKGWEKLWSVRVHLALYLLVVLMVFTGFMQGVFFEQPVRIFGLINITAGHNETLMEPFHEGHEIIATLLKLLIAVHVLAGLKHQFVDRQPVLKRMF
ncbi:MAG: cytochrome b/b6 domain-containing protein [Gammaproteobacteria bacterium]|nr:cytochrome b [Pseudomonadales bacterium]MCP5347092.1 cytochrome b [Pseudomonadales bacterium]